LVAACSFALAFAANAGDVYQWRDAEGHIHFGDKPPTSGAKLVPMKPSPRTVSPTESTEARRERTQRLLDEYATERSEREAERTKQAAALAERRRVCAEARDRVYELESAGSVYTRDAAGNKQIQPESALRQEREIARARVKEVCRGDAAGPLQH
jgi:Domain of unknown function (DUF4124)